MSDWVVGADLGATKIALGLIDPDDRIVARQRLATEAARGPASLVERIAGAVARLEDQLPAGEVIEALGLCSPGPVDHESGMLIDPPNLHGLHHTPLRQMLAERLGVPVVLEHDAKSAALGEYWYGAGRGERSMVYVVVGTGVGAAIVIDGELYRGAHNSAGEIGHTTLDPEGEVCSCGSRGCVETYLAGPWLARRYERARVREGLVASELPLMGERVASLAGQRDPLALEVLAGAGRALGIAVATMAMVLDIELYVIGSSVARAGDLLLGPARTMVPGCSYDSVSCRVRIVTTELWGDGPILGAGWLARALGSADSDG